MYKSKVDMAVPKKWREILGQYLLIKRSNLYKYLVAMRHVVNKTANDFEVKWWKLQG